jgi:hypothetical protein
VRCFADPDAHRHGDRTPSCSVNLDTGAWKCHGCGAKGGAYDAAIAHGLSRRRGMELLAEYDLAVLDRSERPIGRAPMGWQPGRHGQEFALDATVHHVRSWADRLQNDGALLDRLATQRGWRLTAIRELDIGCDASGRITIPIRGTERELRGVLRYDPFGEREPKMLASRGTELGLIPHPAVERTPHVILVEGPPDMIATRSLGLPAIAVPGTNAWRTEWAELLRGRRVTIVMDCDAAGRAAAAQIASDLEAMATPTTVDLWPDRDDGYDLTDRIVDRQRRGSVSPRAIACLLTPSKQRTNPSVQPITGGRPVAQHSSESEPRRWPGRKQEDPVARTGNSEFDSAAHLLRAPLIASRTADLIDDERVSIEFLALLERSGVWSTGERMLVDVALDLWNGDGETTLSDVVGSLDDRCYDRVMEAVAIRRGRA